MTAKPDPSAIDTSGLNWIKASASGGAGNCFEAAVSGGHALVRDSKNPSVPPLVFTPDEARALVAGMKAGDFDFLLNL